MHSHHPTEPRRATASLRGRRRYRLRDPRRFLTVLGGLVLVLTAAVWGATLYGSGNAGLGEAPSAGSEGLAGPGTESKEQATWLLLLGVDRRSGDDGRSDSAIALRLAGDSSRLHMLSIPRDTRVNIPGRGTGKLNAAYALGGPELAMATVSHLLGVPIQFYVAVDMDGFRWAVDQLGGVELEVERRMQYEDPYQGLHINLQPGLQRLNGDQALQYLRFRLSADGQHDSDLTRMERQRRFLLAMARQSLVPGQWPEVMAVLKGAGEYLETNLSAGEQVSLAHRVLEASKQIETATLPGETAEIGGAWYYLADAAALEQLLETWRLGEPAPGGASQPGGDSTPAGPESGATSLGTTP